MGKTRITARTEFGQSEIARLIPLNRHHHYNVDPATGRYVDATGKVVPRSLRFAPTVAFADKEFPVPLRDPLASFFRPGSLVNNTVTLGQNTTSTNFFLSFNSTPRDGRAPRARRVRALQRQAQPGPPAPLRPAGWG